MTITQNFQEKVKEKNNVLEYARKLFGVRDDIINLLKKGFFRIKIMHLKQKKKNQKKTS